MAKVKPDYENKQIGEASKLPITKIRKILGKTNIPLTDSKLKEVRDFLYQLALIEYEQFRLKHEK